MIRAGALGFLFGCALMAFGLWLGIWDPGTYDDRAQAGGGLIGFFLAGGIMGMVAGLVFTGVARKR